MYKVLVFVTYKESVLDPQGEAIKGAIHGFGYEQVEEVRMGKYFEIKVKGEENQVEAIVEDVCDKLLANVNMESYRYEIIREGE